MWATLKDSLEHEMDDFAAKLFAKGIIGRGVRKNKNYEAMMDAFVTAMALFETVEDFKEYCSKLLDILKDIGGTAVERTGATLKESWNTAVRREYGIDFL